MYVYQELMPKEVDTRLRFFVCDTLEDMLSRLFDNCKIEPFGSAVNGFGRFDCDLDMTFTHSISDSKVSCIHYYGTIL